jgi:hypothetical protein
LYRQLRGQELSLPPIFSANPCTSYACKFIPHFLLEASAGRDLTARSTESDCNPVNTYTREIHRRCSSGSPTLRRAALMITLRNQLSATEQRPGDLAPSDGEQSGISTASGRH